MDNIQKTAANYRRRGYAIVWLRPDGKSPRRKGWRERSDEPEDYRDGDALGIQTGETSGGNLVCIDLDGDAAIRLADEHLPPTRMTEGRPGRPRSHRWYHVTNIPRWAWSPYKDNTPWMRSFRNGAGEILAFKGTGGYAVVPPSGHPSGERREWQPGGKPAEVDFLVLWDAVLKVAAGCGYKVQARDRGELEPAKRPVGRPRKNPTPPPHVVAPDGIPPDDQFAVDMARAWLARHDPAISGQDGRRRTYVAARWLVNDFNLSVDAAWPLLLEWNERCRPPWDADELRGILKRTAAAPDDPAYPRGRKLAPPGDWNDPFRLAREFMAEEATWRLWNSLGWRYTGTHYEKAEEGELDRASGGSWIGPRRASTPGCCGTIPTHASRRRVKR